jgi:hypothetical protein
MENHVYRCGFESGPVIEWQRIEGKELVGTVNGEEPRLQTIVKMCRSADYVHVRFECEDDHVVATYENRDDPIYREDVVEIFIDEAGAGTHYKEYEFSPRNVIFDALIEKKPDERPIVNTDWDHEGLRSRVAARDDGWLVYDIDLPVSSFGKPPVPGTSWRMNFYRIDGDPQGNRHYWAWSPTGKVDYHKPEKFGYVLFK